ncbi:MAG: 50S ribosomal protein L25 [Candidatus Nealsonbacteria bacterium]|nr:50S ribosomal protein L25 [Candidatus Nealsonbacteria bacterium]
MKISFQKRSSDEKKDRRGDHILAVLYGSGVSNTSIKINAKEFDKLFKEAGESSLISLESETDKEKYSVLIHEVQKNPLTRKIIHVDFYQPDLKEEVEVSIPLIFEGIPPAVKELGGTLVKNFSELEVKALPNKLPRDIKINVEVLKTFDDVITIGDLVVPKDVTIMGDLEEIVALVTPVEDVEKELEKPIEEDVSSVKKEVKEKKEEVDED